MRAASGRLASRALLPAAVVLALSAACSTGTATDRPGTPTSEEAGQAVTVTFTQLPIQVGTNEGLLRLTNTGATDLAVTGVGLDWSGYGGEFVRPKDSVVVPGQTLDFPVRLPRPECGDGSTEVVGVVEVGEAMLRTRLEDSGVDLLRRVRMLACQEQLVRESVDLEYAEEWTAEGTGRDSSVLGHLRLERRQGDEPIRLTAAKGSVLFELALPGPSTLPGGVRSGEVPLRILPGGRCDEHARSQATAPFAFRLTLRIGRETATVPLPPPRHVQARANELLDRACG